MDSLLWPVGFYDIGGRSFKWVYSNRKDFVDFTLTEMELESGLFLKWKQYCQLQLINDPLTSIPAN